jgi:hypothetical protein
LISGVIFVLSEWLWILALLPLWALATAATIGLVICFELATKISLSDGFYLWSAIAGLILATVGLVWIECAEFVELPFLDRICRSFGY